MRCWIAPRDIPCGADWPATLERAISTANAFVLLLSREADQSEDVRKEVDLAAEPDFYTEIAEDVQSGCEEHGVVLSAHVDRESIQGRVLVRFASAESAVAAQRAMNGRLFAGKSVQASFMHEGAFEEFVKRQEGQT